MEFVENLVSLNACAPGLDWVRDGDLASLRDAWAVCERGDWMVWYISSTAKSDGEKRAIKEFVSQCSPEIPRRIKSAGASVGKAVILKVLADMVRERYPAAP